MASINKKKKLKNSFCVGSIFKDKNLRLKKMMFFTASQRKNNNKQLIELYEQTRILSVDGKHE